MQECGRSLLQQARLLGLAPCVTILITAGARDDGPPPTLSVLAASDDEPPPTLSVLAASDEGRLGDATISL